MRRLIATWALILAWGLTLPAAVHAADGLIQAKNFQADAQVAAQRQIPIMILFSTPGCSYCAQVKREYLVPMHKDAAYRDRVIIREVNINSFAPLTGLNGKITSGDEFAAEYQVFVVPTVITINSRGKPTSEALVGLMIPDFYFGYLESAINQGLSKIRGK